MSECVQEGSLRNGLSNPPLPIRPEAAIGQGTCRCRCDTRHWNAPAVSRMQKVESEISGEDHLYTYLYHPGNPVLPATGWYDDLVFRARTRPTIFGVINFEPHPNYATMLHDLHGPLLEMRNVMLAVAQAHGSPSTSVELDEKNLNLIYNVGAPDYRIGVQTPSTIVVSAINQNWSSFEPTYPTLGHPPCSSHSNNLR